MRFLAAFVLVAACKPPRTEEVVRKERLACTHKAGALPKDTLAEGTLLGDKLPFDHVVLVMQENRSFDHYFAGLSHGGVITAGKDGREHLPAYCVEDISHSWTSSHKQWNDGGNDGFLDRAHGYYDENDLPFYYGLARHFAISDMHFASLLGPTWPNRMFYFAGTSFGLVRNGFPDTHDSSGNRANNLFEELTEAGIDWRFYVSDAPSAAFLLHTYTDNLDRFLPIDRYYVDAAAGTLPAVSVVEARYTFGRTDEHAPSDIQYGQAFTESIARGLFASPQWPRSVMFLTYDEHGGFYDHVQPPEACRPDDHAPILEETDMPGEFDRYGFRVPIIAISPFSKRGYVSHNVTDLTSVTRFIEARFDLPAMTARDANADPLFDLFDFTKKDVTIPDLPEAVIDNAQAERCAADFPSGI